MKYVKGVKIVVTTEDGIEFYDIPCGCSEQMNGGFLYCQTHERLFRIHNNHFYELSKKEMEQEFERGRHDAEKYEQDMISFGI